MKRILSNASLLYVTCPQANNSFPETSSSIRRIEAFAHVVDIYPTIMIVEGSPEWDAAFVRWLAGKLPTDSPDWKRGTFLSRF